MTPEQGLEELVAATTPWQWNVVELAMYGHAWTDPACVGWTMGVGNMCKAWCGHCGWEIAARLDESIGAARFGLAALGMVGFAFERLLKPALEMIGEMVKAAELNEIPIEDPRVELVDRRIDVVYTMTLKQVSFAGTVNV